MKDLKLYMVEEFTDPDDWKNEKKLINNI